MSNRITHWSPADNPSRAICGRRILREDFSVEPTCPNCQRELEEEQRQIQKLREERTA